jgi:hypothetical protein
VPGFADWLVRLGQSKGPEGETVSDGGTRKRLAMLAEGVEEEIALLRVYIRRAAEI